MSRKHLGGSLLTLLLICVLALAQDPKQALNDQLYEAVRKGDAAAVTSLLDKGADVNAKFRYGTTALFKAAERGNAEIVKILLARGADVSVKDTFYGATAMTWAMDNGNVEVVKALLEKLPSAVDDVLMTGVDEEKPELVKTALAAGNLKKETLTRALFISRGIKDKPEIGEMLKSAGAVMPPEINPATLQSYAGKYKGGEPAFEINVSVSEGRLSAAVAGQRVYRLMPLDESTFRPVRIDNVVVKFKVDQGKVTGMTLTQGPSTTQLSRVDDTKQP
ncbi:MAG TPA: ankyrin repeat domain-containing protein [Pyrinomonadaceae bacterium]